MKLIVGLRVQIYIHRAIAITNKFILLHSFDYFVDIDVVCLPYIDTIR